MSTIEIISEDKRGWMKKLTLNNGDIFWISFTKKGFARGGDIHDGRQYDTIIRGQFLVKQHFPEDIEMLKVIITGDSIIIPAGIPHVFIAMEDTEMIEWHDDKLPPFDQKKYYEPYRKLCR